MRPKGITKIGGKTKFKKKKDLTNQWTEWDSWWSVPQINKAKSKQIAFLSG